MFQPMPPQLLDVAVATIAERHAQADRERFLRQARSARRPKLTLLPSPSRPASSGRIIRLFFDRTPPAPEAA